MKKKLLIMTFLLTMVSEGHALSLTLDFEDTMIPVGPILGELEWFGALGVYLPFIEPPGIFQGYYNVSQPGGEFVASSLEYQNPVIVSSLTPFNFESVYLATDSWDNAKVNVMAFLGNDLISQDLITVNSSSPFFYETTLFTGIDTLAFIFDSPGLQTIPSNALPRLVMDNFSYNTLAPVPEPATILLFATGLAGFVGGRIKKRKA